MFNQPPSMPPIGAASSPNVGAAPAPSAPNPSVAPYGSVKVAKASNTSLIKTVVIVLLSLLLVGAFVLAYYFYNEYRIASDDVDAKIANAVTESEKKLNDQLEAEFAEREKNPHRIFTGPEDYGSLSFEYPKTWSVYISKDASNGGNFEAYLHPSEVHPVSDKTINALRVTIETTAFEKVIDRYKKLAEKGQITTAVITVGGTDATRYSGQLTNDIRGTVVIFKIRDKIVSLQSDADIYKDDFEKILATVSFNE